MIVSLNDTHNDIHIILINIKTYQHVKTMTLVKIWGTSYMICISFEPTALSFKVQPFLESSVLKKETVTSKCEELFIMKFKIFSFLFLQITISLWYIDLYIPELLVISLVSLFVHLFDMYFDLVTVRFWSNFYQELLF